MITRPADQVGAETLEIMQAAPKYHEWQFRRIAPYLGRRICEVGAGIGNMSSLIAKGGPELLVVTDTDPYYREVLRERFTSSPEVVVDELTLPDISAGARYQRYSFDTVVALNVVEHIDADVDALRSIAAMLPRGGRAVILVPALPGLFGSLDRELGHVRRYTRSSLSRRMHAAGFLVVSSFYFNLVGTIGWWVNARLRKVPRIPLTQLRYFDALVPMLRFEDRVPLPFGQSLIAIGAIAA
jgi:2-polyprenyl-3-methyl-5-hydroxy-6-metoxy-1,4-benzoquinol methylase